MAFSNLSSRARVYSLTFVALCLVLFTATSFHSVPKNVYDFASTPSSSSASQPPWLLITSAASDDFQRRLMVRWTWVSLFKSSGLFDHIFAVSSNDTSLIPLLKAENDTFGDIMLIDIQDTAWTANRIKPFEFFRKVTTEGWKGRTYDFVSKVDSDSFVDPVRTWNKYLGWRMSATGIEKDRLMLSMPHEHFCKCPSPQGGFYTLSWDLAKIIGRLYGEMEHPENIGQEDCMVGRFPTDAGEEYEFQAMDHDESFDVVGEEGNATAMDWTFPEQVERGPLDTMTQATFLHQMKEEWKWMVAKDLFDKDGWIPNRGVEGKKVTASLSSI